MSSILRQQAHHKYIFAGKQVYVLIVFIKLEPPHHLFISIQEALSKQQQPNFLPDSTRTRRREIAGFNPTEKHSDGSEVREFMNNSAVCESHLTHYQISSHRQNIRGRHTSVCVCVAKRGK